MLGMKYLPLSTLRVMLLRLCGVKIGKGCFIGFNVRIDTNYPELIAIGDHVTISHDVSIYAHTATPCTSALSSIYNYAAKTTVGDGAWIGATALLLPGVIIAPDTMIGAGSVVSKSTESNHVYAGNPAIKLKQLGV